LIEATGTELETPARRVLSVLSRSMATTRTSATVQAQLTPEETLRAFHQLEAAGIVEVRSVRSAAEPLYVLTRAGEAATNPRSADRLNTVSAILLVVGLVVLAAALPAAEAVAAFGGVVALLASAVVALIDSRRLARVSAVFRG
jgi:hypothetical protein